MVLCTSSFQFLNSYYRFTYLVFQGTVVSFSEKDDFEGGSTVSKSEEISNDKSLHSLAKLTDCLVVLQAVTVFAGRQEVPIGIRPASAGGFRIVYGKVTKLSGLIATVPTSTLAFANGFPPLGFTGCSGHDRTLRIPRSSAVLQWGNGLMRNDRLNRGHPYRNILFHGLDMQAQPVNW